MIGGLESARSVLHLSQLFKLADQAGLLRDGAGERMRRFLSLAGIGQNDPAAARTDDK
jgi:hypothetical protein